MVDDDELTPEGSRYLELGAGADGDERFAAATATDVEVEQGSVRVYHVAGSGHGRPVVFIPGWGAVRGAFGDFYGALSRETEVFHMETREKSTSKLDRRSARFSMDHFARDVRRVVDHFSLSRRNPVLMGTCFGAAIALHGTARGILDVRTIVCVDPMDELWMPRWIINVVGPTVPVFVLRLLRSLIGAAVLAGMREPVQRARTREFIRAATVWKWRRAAIAVKDWMLSDLVRDIPHPVHVVNGSHDRFHRAGMFPGIARALPHGVFVRIPVGEARRERMMGITASVFAESAPSPVTPRILHPFVQAAE